MARRRFVGSLAALALANGVRPAMAADPPMETTRITLFDGPFLCFAPLYVALDLLALEGFTDIRILKGDSSESDQYGDVEMWGAPTLLAALERGAPLTMLSGMHVGCWELFAQSHIDGIADLKARTIAVTGERSVEHLWIASLLSYVGINPARQVNWLHSGSLAASQRAFLEGKVDAYLAFPPQPQEMRLLKRGHVLINTTFDRPWSQYFCCMIAAKKDYLARYPVATKRALRALIKAMDLCERAPEHVATLLRDRGIETRVQITREVLAELPYGHWRDWDPRDTVRFHALRLRDAGMIQRTPARILREEADFSLLEALRRELKA